MSKSKREIVALALRHVGVLASDEQPSADQYDYAGDVLDAVFAEENAVQGWGFTWDTDTVPDGAAMGLSQLLAAEIAPHYMVPGPPRSRGIARLRAFAFPDDRADPADLDDDGTVTDAERTAADYGAYF